MTAKPEKDPALVAMGRRLRQLREALGYSTRREFALEEFGGEVTEDRVERWENGHNYIPQRYVLMLKQRCGVTADWLYFGDPSGLPKQLWDSVKEREAG